MNMTRLLCHILSAIMPVLVQGAVVTLGATVVMALVVWWAIWLL